MPKFPLGWEYLTSDPAVKFLLFLKSHCFDAIPPSNIYLIAKPSFTKFLDFSYLLPSSKIVFSSFKSTPEHILIVHCLTTVFVKKDPAGIFTFSVLPASVSMSMRGFPNLLSKLFPFLAMASRILSCLKTKGLNVSLKIDITYLFISSNASIIVKWSCGILISNPDFNLKLSRLTMSGLAIAIIHHRSTSL